ncbi:MAG: helix-turn-helix transcriptional regulator [Scytonema sp. PMC 1069.18]|nr:helix-turn-helix transcriptional regulator [Scytonema sp. PMC 1069.18]MEC4882911.1 helix-turn-helix transcriptional regulator [Scytonema sp. PMC 1070.18]
MSSQVSLSSVNWRASTVASRYESVKQVILMMSKQLDTTFSLEDMADIAMLSPCHFNRIFRQITGIPPFQFLYLLRLQAAKRLLLTTELNVTEICYAVGYSSLSTFINRFTQLIGLSPSHLRRLAKQITPSYWELFCQHLTDLTRVQLLGPCINIKVSEPNPGLIFVGLFPSQIPQSCPVSYRFVTAPGFYRIAPVPDGRYYAIAAALTLSQDVLTLLLEEAVLQGCMGSFEVRNGQVSKPISVTLQPKCLTNPPLLIPIPFLLSQWKAFQSVKV